MVFLENLSKIYSTPEGDIVAVSDVTLNINKGDFVLILGHSGSGKTTLLNLIGGLTRPTSGNVFIDGRDIWSLSDKELSILRNRKLGFIFQFSSLIPTLRVIENLLLPVSFYGKPKDDVLERAKRLLDMVGLSDKIYAYPSQLSGGQQRRAAITRALMNNPEIILADEPTGDLDEQTEEEVITLFNRINEESGITFIIVTHNSSLASKSKHVLRMHNGKIENG